jgi:hypothetical protein
MTVRDRAELSRAHPAPQHPRRRIVGAQVTSTVAGEFGAVAGALSGVAGLAVSRFGSAPNGQ